MSRHAPPSSQSPWTGSAGRRRAVVGELVLVGPAQEPQRRAAPDRAEHGREAAERRLPRPVRPEDERPDEAGARVRRRRSGRARRPRPARAPRRGSRRARTRRSWRRCRRSRSRRTCAAAGSRARARPPAASPTLPGRFAITTSSSTCGASAGSDSRQLARVAVRDDDGGDLHAERLPVDGERPLRGRAPAEGPRALEPGARRAGRARRARGGCRRRGAPPRRRRPRRPATSRSAGSSSGDDGRAARHRLEHRQPEALEARRLHEAGGAAVELGELLLRDVAAQVARRARAARAASAASFSGPTTTSGSPTASAAASAASWFLRGCTAPTASTYVAERRLSPGAKAGSTPFGVTTTFSGGEAVEPDEVARVRSETVSTRAARAGGARHDAAEDEPVLQRHERGVVLEGEVVDRDDRGARGAERERRTACARARRRARRSSAAASRASAAPAPASAARAARYPSGTSSGCRVDRGEPEARASASAASSRSRFRTYVSSPVRRRPSTSASTTTSGARHAELPAGTPATAALDGTLPRVAAAHARGRAARARRAARSASSIPAAIDADVERVDEHGRAAGDLRHRAAGARHDRRAAGHRLERGDAEALVERRVDEAARAAVERRELLVVDPAEPGDVLPATPTPPQPGAPTSRSSTPASAVASTTRREVLARLERPDREHVVALGGVAVRRGRPARRAFGTTSIRSGSTPASSTTSRFENSETATTRSAARDRRRGAPCGRRAASSAGRPRGGAARRGRARSRRRHAARAAARGRSCSGARRPRARGRARQQRRVPERRRGRPPSQPAGAAPRERRDLDVRARCEAALQPARPSAPCPRASARAARRRARPSSPPPPRTPRRMDLAAARAR